MRKILLVEDEPILREVYEEILSTQPYDYQIAENGQDALDTCHRETFDLILLDMMMPILDGIGFLRAYPDMPTMKDKIIVMSNLSSGKNIEQAKKLGIHDFILKSDISPKELVAAIRYHLEG